MNDNAPLISVIIPVYKVEQYLDECVNSVRNQTYRNLEIILVDDGSPDNCGAMCDEYARQDSRITVIHKTNGGLSDARNAGMKIAKGSYWFFVDSDDFIHLCTIELLVKEAERTGADIVMAGTHPFLDGQSCTQEPPDGKAERLSQVEAMRRFAQNDWGAWGKLYRREIHSGIWFPYGKIHEDEAIVFRILQRCTSFVQLEDGLYFYRKRAGSITSVSYSVRKMDWLYAWAENVQFVKETDEELYLRSVSKLWIVMLYNLDHLIGRKDCFRELDDIVKLAKQYEKDILRNPYVTRNAKLRLRVLRLSNVHKPGCLYANVYLLLRRIRGK